jgi:hypothetical protein
LSSADVAREVNRRIYAAAPRLGADADTMLHFICECGCMQQVKLTVAEYERAGAASLEEHEVRAARRT